MRKITIGIVIVLEMTLFAFSVSVEGTSFSVSYNGFQAPGDFHYLDNLELEAADVVYWDFKTIDNSFKVRIDKWGAGFLSYGKTVDNGSFGMRFDLIWAVFIENIDPTESGSYELNISVNPLSPSPSISGYSLFILLGIIGLTLLIIKKNTTSK